MTKIEVKSKGAASHSSIMKHRRLISVAAVLLICCLAFVGAVGADASTPVAKVGDTEYNTIEAAITAAAATEEKVVTVLQTIEITENGDLNLQGVRLNANSSIQNAPVFRILAEVTVTNGIVDGMGPVAGEGGINCYAFIVGNSETAGKLTITGGTYRGVTSAIFIENGTVNISDGVFQTGHDNEDTDYGATYLLNCEDSAYKNGKAEFKITGGRFNYFNPENNAAEGERTNFLRDNYKASDYYDNDKWYVAQANVVMDGDKYFATIKDALWTLSSADTTVHTVKVLQDLEIDVNYATYNYPILVNGFSIELDLNGKTITADWSKYTGTRKDNAIIGVCNGGKLDIIDSVGGGKIVNNDDKANVENRIFWIMTSTATKSIVVNIKGGTYVQNDVNTALLYVQGNKPSDNLAPLYVNIEGGHFETVNGDFFNAYDGFEHESYITGGTFNKNPTDWEIKIHPDWEFTEGANGVWGAHAKETTITFWYEIELGSKNATYDKTGLGDINPFTPPTRTGYTLSGWNTSESDGVMVVDAEGNLVSNVEGYTNSTGHWKYENLALTLYANWTPNPYSVTFNANGGEGTMVDQPFTYDVEQSLTALNFTKIGHTFNGWNTAADGSGTEYADMQSVKNLTPEKDGVVILYAQWEEIPESPSSSGGGSSEGSYFSFPRTTTNGGLVDFGSSKVVKALMLPEGSSGSVVLKLDTIDHFPEKLETEYTFDISVEKLGEGVSYIHFEIPEAKLTALELTPADICAYHYEGEVWTKLPTTYEVKDGVVCYEAETDSFSPFKLVIEKGAAVPKEEEIIPTVPPVEEPEDTPVDKPEDVLQPIEPIEPTEPATPAPLFAVLAGLGAAVLLRRR